jgi:hypothetical protein
MTLALLVAAATAMTLPCLFLWAADQRSTNTTTTEEVSR